MRFMNPSRQDAELLTSSEKAEMIAFTNAVSLLHDANDRLQNRFKKIEDGPERIQKIADESHELLEDVRVTIPEKQRKNLMNISRDFAIRLVPLLTPNSTNVLVPQDDFRKLVTASRTKCRECTLDEDECQKECELFGLLSAVLPISEYKAGFLCPYNLAKWGDGNRD